MPWPGLNDLQEALQHPERAFTDRELRDGKIALNKLGLPLGAGAATSLPSSKSSPTVIPTRYAALPTTHWVSKTTTRPSTATSKPTAGPPLSSTSTTWKTGLVCRGQKYPLIKMPWINGQTLDEFTYENISRADVLEQLVSKWYQAATELQQLPIAHNDLQHGNIMVVKGSRSDIKLVDYDGLYVPQFAQMQSPENGHRHYQHPQRDQRHYGPQVDNFPALVIYTSLTALAHDSGARARRATPESLLFAQDDLQDPTNSKLFQYLKQSPHRPTSQLANVLSEAALAPVDDTPTLEQARTQPPKGSLPSWLNQPTPPSAPAWTKAVTPVQPTSTNTFRPPTTAPVAAPDPAQHNRHLIGQTLQQINSRLKPIVISYALETERTGWRLHKVPGINGNQIRTVQDLDAANPDTAILTTVLHDIANHRLNTRLSNIPISTSRLREIRDISNDLTQSRVDFSNQRYVDNSLEKLVRFVNSLSNLTQNFQPADTPNRPIPARIQPGQQPGTWDTPRQIIRTIATRYHVGIIVGIIIAIYGLLAVYSLPRFENNPHRAETYLAVVTVAFISAFVSSNTTARKTITRIPRDYVQVFSTAWANQNPALRYINTGITLSIPAIGIISVLILVPFLLTDPPPSETPRACQHLRPSLRGPPPDHLSNHPAPATSCCQPSPWLH